MAIRKLSEVVREAVELRPDDQVRLAKYLLDRNTEISLKPTPNMNQFRGGLQLTVDPMAFQREIRSEWP